MATLTSIGPKPSEGEVLQVLNFLKPFVTKPTYNKIKHLLNPCCHPTFVFDTFGCNWDGQTWGALLMNVTINSLQLAGKTVTVIITAFGQQGGGVLEQITLDSNGFWNGNLQSSWGASANTLDISPALEYNNELFVGDNVTITGVPNCD